MTVKELRDSFTKLDGEIEVIVRWEHNGVRDLLRIHHVSVSKGTAIRVKDEAGSRFESSGPDELAFINAVED
jgi:hypothetical protein